LFNELTLSLHVLLLVSIYLFLFVVVRTISRDVRPDTRSPESGPGALNSHDMVEQQKPGKEFPKIVVTDMDTGNSETAQIVYDELFIGRAQDCDIMLADTFVSSRHARVYQMGDSFWLEDMGSTNGTTFDQIKIVEPVRLINGDEFIISKYKFKFVM
jgi:pSer/pThr/pTyr-binding forkhead associated (FHA) protein